MPRSPITNCCRWLLLPLALVPAGWPSEWSAAVAAAEPQSPEREHPPAATKPFFGETVVRFASPERAREILTRRDAFIMAMSPFDRQVRVGTAEPASTDQVLRYISRQALSWKAGERARVGRLLKSLAGRMKRLKLNPPLPPVVDLVNAGALIVNATDASNAIDYSQGSVAANGLVSVDGFERIEFSNKANLVLNAGAGDDVVNISNSSSPAGLTGITVNGGGPTGSDKLVVNAISGMFDELDVIPAGQGAGTVATTAPGYSPVAFTGIEDLTLVGQFDENDTFGVDGTTTVAAVGGTPDEPNASKFSFPPDWSEEVAQETAREAARSYGEARARLSQFGSIEWAAEHMLDPSNASLIHTRYFDDPRSRAAIIQAAVDVALAYRSR